MPRPLTPTQQFISANVRARFIPPLLSSTVTLFVWLLIQIAALAFASARIALWAQAPRAGELLAIQILFCTQMLGAAMLSPRLAADRHITWMAIASMWPMTALAGILAAAPLHAVAASMIYVSAWVLALWFLNFPLRSISTSFWVAGACSAWAAAGPVLIFIGVEYQNPPFASSQALLRFTKGPLAAGLTWIQSEKLFDARPWMILIIPALVGIAFWAVKIVFSIRSRAPRSANENRP